MTIQHYREGFGWSRSDLAGLLGVTRQAVRAWEEGIAAPRDDMRIALAETFHVPVALLFPLVRTTGDRQTA